MRLSILAHRLSTGLLPGLVETLRESALFQESLFQFTQLLVHQVVSLVYQAKHRVCRDLRRSVLDMAGIRLI
jgi:hypothetical protein